MPSFLRTVSLETTGINFVVIRVVSFSKSSNELQCSLYDLEGSKAGKFFSTKVLLLIHKAKIKAMLSIFLHVQRINIKILGQNLQNYHNGLKFKIRKNSIQNIYYGTPTDI